MMLGGEMKAHPKGGATIFSLSLLLLFWLIRLGRMTTPAAMLTPQITSKSAEEVAGEIDAYNVRCCFVMSAR